MYLTIWGYYILQAYAGEPENPDNAFTDQIRFRCKSPCIESCLKNGGNKKIKFFDSDKPDDEWFFDGSVNFACQDADAGIDNRLRRSDLTTNPTNPLDLANGRITSNRKPGKPKYLKIYIKL